MGVQTVGGATVNEGTEAALAALLAGVPLNGAKLHLYLSSFAPTAMSAAADFIAAEATFTGYAPAPLTWSAIGLDSGGSPTALSARAFFQATDGVTPNSIGGCWLQADTTGPPATHTAVEYYQFPAPVSMATALAFLGVVIGMQLPAGPGYAVIDS